MFDFITKAQDANWGQGVTPINYAGPGHTVVTYGTEAVPSPEGFALIKDKIVIEDGGTSGVILETHPRQENDGYIIGRYPLYKVGTGDYIKGRLGFIKNIGGACGVGNVIFQINYTLGDDLGTMTTLSSWNETCDGTMRKINIDLSSLKGKEVRFYLIILANGDWTDDLAIWTSLAVMR